MKRQMEDAERRETRLSEMLEQALQPGFTQQASQVASPANQTTRGPSIIEARFYRSSDVVIFLHYVSLYCMGGSLE